ncbi:MAG: hypothetical protein HZC28_14160 [Spirochaetes bacterium]|nr:hypothetical protein [Spirochaetota bacterium]
MKMNNITLDFGTLQLSAELFDTKVAKAFHKNLPYSIDLTLWGNEAYGPIGADLGEEHPIPTIPPGGLAYTRQGNYFCIFFGQQPAWPVEYIGTMSGDWKKLVGNRTITRVSIT